ncbi:hypothetical protein LCGC14_1663500 [marine sediment metagenome]|uniref:Uncharacterized protein n=1 Tax=marine sediment metagenome TaxID=412755 RepID=A0A0F9IFY6_9ZZZZ
MVQEGFTPSIDRPTGGESPLLRFKGTLASYVPEERTSNQDQSKYMTILFNFSDVEVIEATEPYPFPIAIIRIGYKPPKDSRGGTKWDAFSTSLRKLSAEGLDAIVGKKQEWAQLPHRVRSPLVDGDGNPQLDGNSRPIWGDTEIPCWKVVEVEGLGSVQEKDDNFFGFLVDLADGKTEPQFYSAALLDEQVRARSNIVTAITDRKLLDTLREMKLIDRDAEGILHKVTPISTEGAGGTPA